MIVEWGAFFQVLLATLIGACGVVTLYSLGLRLIDSDDVRPLRRAAGIVCLVLCGLVILYGVYLVIPFFHQG